MPPTLGSAGGASRIASLPRSAELDNAFLRLFINGPYAEGSQGSYQIFRRESHLSLLGQLFLISQTLLPPAPPPPDTPQGRSVRTSPDEAFLASENQG